MKQCITLFTILIAFTSLVQSQTWVRQNPWPVLARMQDIDFDGDYGLAVGTDSTIFTTTNAGITWIPRTPAEGTLDLLSAHVVPGTNGQLMFAGGNHLFYSEDGGETWHIAYDDIDAVFKVQSFGNGTVVALGDDYGIYSDDNGAFWQPFNYPGEDITAGHFVTTEHGWVQFGTFDNNQVWVTTNGGSTWEIRDSTKHNMITEIIMFDTLEGYMSTLGEVFRTFDGGYHWNSMGAHPSTEITDMHVVNQGMIWTVLDNGFVHFTTTGGGQWHEINPNIINSDEPLGIWANDQGQAWIVGKYVSVLYTPDFGVTWTDQIPNSKETLFKPHFTNEAEGIVGGSDGTIMLTDNGGATWETITFTEDENFYGAQRLDDTLIVGSASGRVMVSHDRGITWDTIATGLGSISDLVAANTNVILVTTEQGRIYGTINGGASWNIVYNNPTTPLFAVDFLNPQQGWAAGHGGHIIQTSTSGVTWTPQFNEAHVQFADIHFVNSLEGWAVASHYTDTIWFTKNGGATWSKTQIPIKSYWRGVSFMNADIGWITGGSAGRGIVMRTDDRGLTWTLDHQSPELLLGIYAVPDEELVWAVGFGGNIMRYSNCNFLPVISNLSGLSAPCLGDTVVYSIQSSDVDIFSWSFPADWVVIGNTNTSSVTVIAGATSGEITIQGADVCENVTDSLRLDVFPSLPPAAHINDVKGTLRIDFESGFYQWLLNGVPIPGATGQEYLPTESGVYSAIVTAFGSGCSVVTNEITITIVATDDLRRDGIAIYPNPAFDQMHLQVTDPAFAADTYTISYFNLSGTKLNEEIVRPGVINIGHLAPGYYLITVQGKDDVRFAKLCKL